MHSYFKNHTLAAGALLLTLDRHCLQDPGILLPYLPVPHHRSRGPGRLPDGLSHLRHLFFHLRRFHPDGHLPFHRCRPGPGWKDSPCRIYHLLFTGPGTGCRHHPLLRLPGVPGADGAPVRAPAPGHGPGHSVHAPSMPAYAAGITERKGTGPGPFPDGGAVHPHLHRLSHCQDLGGTGEAGDGPGGCGRPGGRGGRLRPFYAAFLSSFWKQEKDGPSVSGRPAPSSVLTAAAPLLAMALPLMGNRLVMNLLQSLEAILIPVRLELSGLSRSQALSVYGVLTGMALPFVMFPSAIINSLAVVLLPSVARHQSLGNRSGILKNARPCAFRYSSYMGILCIGIFTSFGDSLGLQVFKSAEAGSSHLHPGLALSLPLSVHHHGERIKRPGKDLRYLSPQPGPPAWYAWPLCSWDPPGRDPGLPLGDAGRRSWSSPSFICTP